MRPAPGEPHGPSTRATDPSGGLRKFEVTPSWLKTTDQTADSTAARRLGKLNDGYLNAFTLQTNEEQEEDEFTFSSLIDSLCAIDESLTHLTKGELRKGLKTLF